ncbi:inositol-1,4,5-trisphosphate 5-phosphatase 11 [Ceratobasidium sp. AG-Ba]|nr:inositol-1,4,5-trisphosphate 5-phosphatase 11 [Ceratobasidium sp. AG-Ba]QRW02012.1 inositol-1,4,5-trisphosphate 5-phosphatase 11 [Ceratobasidium sp. AG-Ba]
MGSHVSPLLRPRILVAASHSFLNHSNTNGALAVYKLLTSMRYAPPTTLTAAINRAVKEQGGAKSTKAIAPDTSIALFESQDIYSLTFLLSTLERSRQPDIMEDVVQDYAKRVSSACLTDSSVTAAMIRGYCAAKQLDGCYVWFHRFRGNLPSQNRFIPAAPYLCLMAASRKLDPRNTKALYRISRMMQEDGIPFIIAAYNELLSSELQNRNFRRVFNLYSALRDSSAAGRPDAYTFSLLFDAFWKNDTGPKHECPLNPSSLLDQMIKASKSNLIHLTIFNINTALRYFVYNGDFQSAISVVDIGLLADIAPNSLTIRWTLEQLLKRCQRAFDPSASLKLENTVKLLLGGLSRDHYAHTIHLLDVVRSTKTSNESLKLTQSVQDALQVIHTHFLSNRFAEPFACKEELRSKPVLSRIRDILSVCANPMLGFDKTC